MIRLRLRARVVDVDLESDARVLCLFGPSGSGKTTCLEAVAGLLRAGEIRVGDRDLTALPPRERRVGYLPQDAPMFPHLDVRGNLAYGARGADPSALAATLGVAELLDRPAAQLSGGEQRRVALGRAILTRPDLLLLDEPFGGLDEQLRARLLAFIARLDVPRVVLVTHDPRDALGLADEVVRLDRGRAVARGAPEELFGPESELVEPGSLLRGTVRATHDPFAELDVGGATFHAHLPGAAAGESVRVRVRADEVTLALARHDDLTARNQVAGTITSLEPRGEQLLATIDAGPRLYAQIDRRSASALGLATGTDVVAQFKASSLKRAGL